MVLSTSSFKTLTEIRDPDNLQPGAPFMELCATRWVLTELRRRVEQELESVPVIGQRYNITEAISEWYDQAVGGATGRRRDALGDALDRVRAECAVAASLHPESGWKFIIPRHIEEFDSAIQVGLDNHWPWYKVLTLHLERLRIGVALAHGLHPTVSIKTLYDYLSTTRGNSQPHVKKVAQLLQSLDIPGDMPHFEVYQMIRSVIQELVASRTGMSAVDVTEKDIDDYFLQHP